MIVTDGKKIIPFYEDYKPVEVRRNNVRIAGWLTETKSGEAVDFENTYNYKAEVLVHGNSMQDGEPSPENPAPVLSAGDCYLLSGIGGRNLVVNSHLVKSANATYLYYPLYLNSIADLKGYDVTITFEARTPNVEDVGKMFSVYYRGGLSTYYFSRTNVVTNDWTRYVITTFIDDEVAETYNKHIAFHFGTPHLCLGEVRNVKVEVGNKATKWTPAPEEVEENTITEGVYKTQLPPLRRIGDVADTYNPTTGEYVQRIGVKVFDGTENFTVNQGSSSSKPNEFRYLHLLPVEHRPLKADEQTLAICTHLIGATAIDTWFKAIPNSVSCYGDRSLCFYVDNTLYPNVGTLQAFLTAQHAAGTPVTVYYQLVEPIITHLDPVTVPTYPGYTRIEQDGAVKGVIEATCKVME